MNNEKHEYYVFARINRGDDLMFIGSVDADSDSLAKIYANFTYDEEDWFEMFVVKKENFLPVSLSDGVMNYESRIKGAEAI
ncbi:hypothetical protein M493_14060 [Geobacillus genomosp. 3]|uniref:Uncharacterized protein n=1 Tax=Geobacillus genomosp. 3 TaxID=1921421 RepID=S5Z882_GEOG3|nr:hypothetical protein [Geobacillus genomosp. 3]AGT33052.1 hypothetical protein M493_14060 [Geobacillus genomosp. 3]